METLDKPFLTSKEAAEFLGYAENTLAHSRVTGKLGGADAPKYVKRGRMVRYKREDLDNWLNEAETKG